MFATGNGMSTKDPIDNHTHLRNLDAGRYFGEVSLVTAAARSSTVITTSRTVLLSIDDKTFRSVLDRNTDHVAEMNIRLAGENVELIHILRHSAGYNAFMEFLEQEHSSESLLFWRAVDRYEELCDRWEAQKQAAMGMGTSEQAEVPPTGADINDELKDILPVTANTTPTVDLRTPINHRMLHELATAIMIRFIFDGASCQVR